MSPGDAVRRACRRIACQFPRAPSTVAATSGPTLFWRGCAGAIDRQVDARRWEKPSSSARISPSTASTGTSASSAWGAMLSRCAGVDDLGGP